jgi:hypothetical protein
VKGRKPGEQNERNDWSLLGFMFALIDDEARFERLMALGKLLLRFLVLFVLLSVAVAVIVVLARVDLIAWYYRETPHATEWQRWGIPPGSIAVVCGGIKFFRYRKRARKQSKARSR